MDKSFEQFSVWWKTARRTLKCDTYEAFEIWQEAQKSLKQNEKTYTTPNGLILVPKDLLSRCISHTIIAQCHPCTDDVSFSVMDDDIDLLEKCLEESNGE